MTDWYAMADLPRLRILKVRVIWGGRELVLTRMRPRGETRWAWFEDRDGEAVEAGIAGDPTCWQPLAEAFWGTVRKPEPIRAVVPRMVYERSRFAAVEEADAADLAREMDADRETARVSRETVSRVHAVPGSQWWWDPTSVTYQPEGHVSQRDAEGRMMRALAWADVGKGLTLHSKTIGDVLADIAEARERALSGGDLDPVARFQPLPQDQSDFLVAMGWFVKLNPPERRHKRQRVWGLSMPQKVLAWMAQPIPLSSDDMAVLVGRTGARMRQVRAEALDMVHRVANGLPAKAGWPVVDQVAALKERNASARRRQ